MNTNIKVIFVALIMNYPITSIDILLILLYFPMLLIIGKLYSNKLRYKYMQDYFMKGLALKLLCGLGFGLVFVYYYGGGDTTMYFQGASYAYKQVVNGPHGFDVFFNSDLMPHGSKKAATTFTQQFAGAVNLLSFNSFWSCTLLFSALSFIGLWLLFQSFVRQFPKLHKQLAIATLFVPGVVFWSSGIMKDSICMLFVGVIVYSIQNIFLYNQNKIKSIILLLIGFHVLITLKAYIALALIVAIAVYAILALKSRIKNTAVKVLVVPVFAIIIMGSAILSMRKIGESLQRYSLENIVETAQVYQGYHSRTSIAGRGSSRRTGSAYSLGEINFNSPLNLASKFPLAINVTFFRPYIWEVRNPVMMLSAIESMAILYFMIMVIRRAGIGNFFKIIVTNKEVLFCLTFALIFGFAVGFTTYNFGSLVRYKTPCIPFFLVGLVLINSFSQKDRDAALKKLPKRFQLPYTIPEQPA